MDIQEAGRRIWHRLPVVLLLMAVGAGAGFALHASEPATYTSSTRLDLGASGVASPGALADEALAIATSPTRVEAAIAAAGVIRDSDEVADQIRVDSLGNSAVLALRVSDAEPSVASVLANSLTEQVVATRLNPGGQLTELTEDLSALHEDIGQLLADAEDADIDELAMQLETLSARLSELESVLTMLEINSETAPNIIEQARPAALPDPSRRVQDTALGSLLGLIGGICVAVVLEILRPTLVGPRSIADVFGGAHLLGRVPPQEDRHETSNLLISPMVAASIARAGWRAGVTGLRLIAVDQSVSLESMADELRTTLPQIESLDSTLRVNEADLPRRQGLAVARWVPHTDILLNARERSTGVVLVAPSKLARSRTALAHSVVDLLGEPVLGILTYRPRDLKRAQRARSDDGASPPPHDSASSASGPDTSPSPGSQVRAWLQARPE